MIPLFIYGALFEHYVSDEGQRRTLDRMDGSEDAHAATWVHTLDVRWIVPHRRSRLLCEAFAALVPGEAVLLLDDRDPTTLCTECETARMG